MKRVGRAVEFLAWSAFFVFVALVVALRFWLLPDIERHRERIVSVVAHSIGQPVRIGGIAAGWIGLNPRLELRDVRIYDAEGREALVLPAVENVVSWRSLVRGRVKLHSLAIDGLRVQVRRDAQGALHVAGMRLGGEGGFSDWLLAQDEIVLRNAEVEWHDEQRGAPPLALSALNLRLRNAGDEHSIGMTATPPASLGSTVELRALLEGENLAAGQARVYLEVGYTELAAWRAWLDYPWAIDEGQGALRAWLTLDGGRVTQATADVALAGVSARFGEAVTPLRLTSVQGRLKVRQADPGYELVGRGLAAAFEAGPAIPPTDFELRWSRAGGAFTAAALELQPLAQLAGSLPLPERAKATLEQMKPRGRVADARLEWRGSPAALQGFSARAKFSDVAASAAGEVPGFAGITGSLETTEARGKVQLASRHTELALPQVFAEPRVLLDFLNGEVEWERHGEQGFALSAGSLSFSNPHFSGNASGTYLYSGSGPGAIDLSAQFNRADAAHLGRYLPHARLMGGPGAREWLTRSVLAGRSTDVRVRLRGDLHDFPFADPLRGQFNVSARIEKGVLQFAQGWPRIEDIQGELVFDREGMQVTGRSGSLHNVALANVQVSIPRLRDASPQVLIEGQAEGATADFLRFIQATPVRRMIGGVTDPMSAAGRGKLRLKLELPLRDPAKTRVAGEYEFAGNHLVVHSQVPPIERAAGRLQFTESSVSFTEAQGRVFGGAVAVSGGTRPDGMVQVTAKGEATVEGLRSVFDHPWRRYVSGATSYVATIQVAKGRTHVLVDSPLQGITSTLPAPLAKGAAETLPLRVELLPDERLKVRLGRLLTAEVMRHRAGVALMPAVEAPIRLPERPGTAVYGALPALDVDKWLPLFSGPEPAAEATALDVRIGALDLLGRRLNDVALRAGADAAGWSAAVQAQELAGDLSYRRERGGRLVARLTHLRLPEASPGVQVPAVLQPKDLPALDVVAERFTYRGKQLGRVGLVGQRIGEDWRIEKVTMENAEASLAGSGAWRGGAVTRSHLDFELTTSDAGQFLERVGYPGLVRGGKAQLKGSLQWNGEPGVIDYPSLGGEVQLHAQQGQFLEIEPGLGKLVSLMSLQSLPRRITLDFRDVFSKGFEFERIGAAARIDRGVLALKEFRMRGSSAQVDMRGDVDLAHETQDLRVRVIPSLGDSASTVIALVNPLLAIPAAIAQKILKDPLGHIFAFDYAVTGAWSDPKVAKLGVEAQAVDGTPTSQ